MPDGYITAIGAIVAAGLGATIPQLFARSADKKRFSPSARLAAMEGAWAGEGCDFFTEDGSPPWDFQMKVEFKKKSQRLVANGSLSPAHGQPGRPVLLDGGFYDESYLQFTYRSAAPEKKQMGVIVFRLSGDGITLKGHYAGYSPARNVFVAGIVSLHKFLEI